MILGMYASRRIGEEDKNAWGNIKENIDLVGTPTTQGLAVNAEAMPANAPIVDRMIAAGAIPIEEP